MTRLIACALILVPAAAQAHHIWIIPDRPDGPKATAVFGDTLAPQSPDLLKKIAHTRLFVREASGNEELVEWTKGEDSFALEVSGAGPRVVGGTCVYGVESMDHRLHKRVEPYLLVYHPKTVLGPCTGQKPWERLPLEILAEVSGEKVHLRVLFRGKPAPRAEMFVLADGQEKVELKTDDEGRATLEVKRPGTYGFRTRQIEAKGGEYRGKKYAETRHYASLVLPVGTGAGKK